MIYNYGFIYINNQKMFNNNNMNCFIAQTIVDLKSINNNNNVITELVLIWFTIFIQLLMFIFIFQPICIILNVSTYRLCNIGYNIRNIFDRKDIIHYDVKKSIYSWFDYFLGFISL